MMSNTPHFNSDGTYVVGGDTVFNSSGREIPVNFQNNTILDPGTGGWVSRNSQAARNAGINDDPGNAAKNYANAQNAAEAAQVDQQEVEDRIAENKTRNAGITSLAFSNAQRGGQLGRGLFQRRQAGTRIGAALGSLASANAAGLRTARMRTLKAKQAADITRSNPVLGYQAALAGLARQMG